MKSVKEDLSLEECAESKVTIAPGTAAAAEAAATTNLVTRNTDTRKIHESEETLHPISM